MTLPIYGGFSARMLIWACAFILSGAATAIAGPRHVQTTADGWTTYKSDEFGYSLYYPSVYFEPQAIAEERGPKTFLSPDGKAKLVVSAAENDEGFTLTGYRA